MVVSWQREHLVNVYWTFQSSLPVPLGITGWSPFQRPFTPVLSLQDVSPPPPPPKLRTGVSRHDSSHHRVSLGEFTRAREAGSPGWGRRVEQVAGKAGGERLPPPDPAKAAQDPLRMRKKAPAGSFAYISTGNGCESRPLTLVSANSGLAWLRRHGRRLLPTRLTAFPGRDPPRPLTIPRSGAGPVGKTATAQPSPSSRTLRVAPSDWLLSLRADVGTAALAIGRAAGSARAALGGDWWRRRKAGVEPTSAGRGPDWPQRRKSQLGEPRHSRQMFTLGGGVEGEGGAERCPRIGLEKLGAGRGLPAKGYKSKGAWLLGVNGTF